MGYFSKQLTRTLSEDDFGGLALPDDDTNCLAFTDRADVPWESELLPLLLESVASDDPQCYRNFPSRDATARIASGIR